MTSNAAFSSVAQQYDAAFTETAVGKLQRSAVWALLQRQTSGRPKVLEINCGTGEDALWMARQGWQVLATDISPDMVQVARKKIAGAGLSRLATAEVCAFADIGRLAKGPFDLIFSNFGGLNCIPPDELARLGDVLLAKLKPGGHLVAVVMGRFCWWESLYFLLKMNPSKAFRRRRRGPVAARLDDHSTVNTWYYSPREFRLAFQASGARTGTTMLYPVGFWLPPSYLDPFFVKYPRLLRLLQFLERKFTASWLAPAADHYFIRLSRRP